MTPIIWVESRGDGLRKVEEIIQGANNMCTVVGNIISSVAQVAGYGGKKSRYDVPIVVLGEGLIDIHG